MSKAKQVRNKKRRPSVRVFLEEDLAIQLAALCRFFNRKPADVLKQGLIFMFQSTKAAVEKTGEFDATQDYSVDAAGTDNESGDLQPDAGAGIPSVDPASGEPGQDSGEGKPVDPAG